VGSNFSFVEETKKSLCYKSIFYKNAWLNKNPSPTKVARIIGLCEWKIQEMWGFWYWWGCFYNCP
jgi:hypothetical protein